MRDFDQTSDPIIGARPDTVGSTQPEDAPEAASSRRVVQPVAIPDRDASASPAGRPVAIDIGLFDHISVQVQVTLGQAVLDLGALLRMRDGDQIKTERRVDQPVDVVVNGNVVARGELVVVDEHFGVRITQVASKDPA
jgi:flagellar motor switch protein FliN/FliY